MSNQELSTSVSEELQWDPKLDGDTIAVSADEGVVTLRGTVGSFHQKRQARKAAERVNGVLEVKNGLTVRLMTQQTREDAEIRADVLRALALDAQIPDTVDARVSYGNVTLSGYATWQFERDAAERVAGRVAGVLGVLDEIALIGRTPDPQEVKRSIKRAYERHAKLDANKLTVETRNGTVMVEGTVRSWEEHDDAVAAAWAAPGVRDVDDRIVLGS
jgi:osmotically-inducible protein OsmY